MNGVQNGDMDNKVSEPLMTAACHDIYHCVEHRLHS